MSASFSPSYSQRPTLATGRPSSAIIAVGFDLDQALHRAPGLALGQAGVEG